jgi:alpha-beta hydrolase superfamily lysophospholipase
MNITNAKYYESLSKIERNNGLIVISHGMAEYIGRYNWIIDKLNHDGFHVISRDHLGHGEHIKQGAIAGFFNVSGGWNSVTNDLERTIYYAQKKYPNLPTFVLGHSMGSWIALSLLNKDSNIAGMILTGSSKIPTLLIFSQLLIVEIEIILKGYTGVSKVIDNITFRKFNNVYKPCRTNNDWLTSDSNSVDDYTNDPLCGFKVTNGLWKDLSYGLLKIFKKNYYSKNNKNVPILLMTGESDQATQNSKLTLNLYNFLISIFDNVTFKVIKNARHEIFSELNKNYSYSNLLLFLSNK